MVIYVGTAVANLSRDRLKGLLKISQKAFADSLVETFGVVDEKSFPMPVGIKLGAFNQEQAVETLPFRELTGSLTFAGYPTTDRHGERSTGGCEVLRWAQGYTCGGSTKYFRVCQGNEWTRYYIPERFQ